MMVLALLGSSLNLMILVQTRHLRNRPASRWRQKTTESEQNPYGASTDGFVARSGSYWRRRVSTPPLVRSSMIGEFFADRM
jgi:hypothetical protein